MSTREMFSTLGSPSLFSRNSPVYSIDIMQGDDCAQFKSSRFLALELILLQDQKLYSDNPFCP